MSNDLPQKILRILFRLGLGLIGLAWQACHYEKIVEHDAQGQPKRILTYTSKSTQDQNHLIREQSFYFNHNREIDAQYKNGILHGNYRSFWHNGQNQSQGKYRQGMKEGVWEFYFNRYALSSKGEYFHNGKEGLWHEYWENSELRGEGKYHFDHEIGVWKKWNAKGDLVLINSCFAANPEGEYRAYYGLKSAAEEYSCHFGVTYGAYVKYFPDGSIMIKGKFNAQGEKDSVWESFHPNEKKSRRETYHKGLLHDSLWAWNLTGGLSEKGFFKNGSGEIIFYDSSGLLTDQKHFSAGLLDGAYTQYFPSGKLKTRQLYAQGKALRVEKWFENGMPSLQGEYQEGKKHGHWKVFSSNGFLLEDLVYQKSLLEGPAYYYASENGSLVRKQIFFHGYPKVAELHGANIGKRKQMPSR